MNKSEIIACMRSFADVESDERDCHRIQLYTGFYFGCHIVDNKVARFFLESEDGVVANPIFESIEQVKMFLKAFESDISERIKDEQDFEDELEHQREVEDYYRVGRFL
jgi:hypothetical protein